MTEKYQVTGMSCASCSARVEKAVSKLPGVRTASVNLLLNQMTVDYDESALKQADIIQAVVDAGYGASPISAAPAPGAPAAAAPQPLPDNGKELKSMKTRLIASVCFLLPLMYIAMGGMMGLPLPSFLAGMEHSLINAFTQFLLCLPVVVLNRKFYQVGFRALRHRAPNMDSLIAVGSGAALLSGVIGIYRMAWAQTTGDLELFHQSAHQLYLESAAMILTLITLGKYLETRSKGRTGEAISRLIALTPETASLLRDDGSEVETPVAQVVPGDIAVVRAGQRIPVDGVICRGAAAVDESALTGESIPVERGEGDRVDAGTVCQNGFVHIRVDRVGKDTSLSRIIALVEEASSGKAPIARLADKISGVFVPIVMGIALLSAIVWLLAGKDGSFALNIAISVLVISCPCALGLATPVAIMAGAGKGAENGILFRTAQALEETGKVTAVVLDKTGTVTQGCPAVTDLLPYLGDETALLTLASALEQTSTHPLAQAVCREAQRRGIRPEPAQNVENRPGFGLTARVSRGLCAAGSRRLMEELGVDMTPAGDTPEKLEAAGKTLLCFSLDGALLGIIAVADPIKERSVQAVEQFHRLGCKVILLTGDNERAAQAVARAVGADRAIAQVRPEEKEAHIRALQSQGEIVAMVGDGINDAPALTRADTGIAIGGGTDVAIESADVVLTGAQLTAAAQAVRLSRAVQKNIRQNLFWALFYNALGIPVAAGVLYPFFHITLSPMIGAAAMSLSSVFVVTNALRLSRMKLDTGDAPAPSPAAPASPPAPSCPISPAEKAEKPAETPETIPENIQEAIPEKTPENAKEEPKMTRTMQITGMMCQHCVAHVTKALNDIPGVTAQVQLEQGRALVEAGPEVLDETLVQAVEAAGYHATMLN